MKTLGIVAEYNPFHNGHRYHIETSKKRLGATHTVAVMSGDFVMRGEPACCNKLLRAETAVQNGVDLVIELPVSYSLSSAEYFSAGAVSILNSIGCVDFLSFGSECGDLNILSNIAQLMLTDALNHKIKENMKDGIPVFKAIEKALPEYADILKCPNNILAINYLKALNKLDSKIVPYTLKREGADYNSAEACKGIASALAVRIMLTEGKDISEFVPSQTAMLFRDYPPVSEKSFDSAVTYALRMADSKQILSYADVSEGLENLIKAQALNHYGVNEIAMAVKSKRYARTRIKRIIYNIFLNIDKNSRQRKPQYAKVLAFNDKGRELLSYMKTSSKISVVTNPSRKDFEQFPGLSEDYRATLVYSLGECEKNAQGGLICKYVRQ